jgi:hypothetical protein
MMTLLKNYSNSTVRIRTKTYSEANAEFLFLAVSTFILRMLNCPILSKIYLGIITLSSTAPFAITLSLAALNSITDAPMPAEIEILGSCGRQQIRHHVDVNLLAA